MEGVTQHTCLATSGWRVFGGRPRPWQRVSLGAEGDNQGGAGVWGNMERTSGSSQACGGMEGAWGGPGLSRPAPGAAHSGGLALALPPPLLALGVLLGLARPGLRPAQAHHAAGQPRARVAVLQAGRVAAVAQVVLAGVHHHGAAHDGVGAAERGGEARAVLPEVAVPHREVAEVARVVRVLHQQRVVVRPGGLAALAQVPKLMHVDGVAGAVDLRREAHQLEEGLESGAGRQLPEEHKAGHLRLRGVQRRGWLHLADGVEGSVGAASTGRPPPGHLLPDLRHFGVHVAELLLRIEIGVRHAGH